MLRTGARQDPKVHPVRVVPTALLVNPESQANQVFLETTHQFHGTKKANAAGAHLELLDHPDQLDPRDQMASKATQAPLAKPARTDLKDHPDHQAQLARRPRTANPARRESPERTPRRETKDRLAHLAKLEMLDPRATMEKKDLLANPATRPTTDHPAHLDPVASPETRDQLVLPDPKVNLVQMPIIVLARNAAPRLPPRPPRRHKRKDTSTPQSTFKIPVGPTSTLLGDNRKCSNPVLRIRTFPVQASAYLGFGFM